MIVMVGIAKIYVDELVEYETAVMEGRVQKVASRFLVGW